MELQHVSENQIDNLVDLLDGYFTERGLNGITAVGQHLNVNVLQPEELKRACEQPEIYGDLTVRISGYAVRVRNLTDEQRQELLQRTVHEYI